MCASNNEWARVQKAAYSRPATLRESYVEVPAWILTAGPHLPPFFANTPPLSNVYEQVFRNKKSSCRLTILNMKWLFASSMIKRRCRVSQETQIEIQLTR